MHISIIFPVADTRKFTQGKDTLVSPMHAFPFPSESTFIRGSGPLALDLDGAVEGWVSERVYCFTHRAIRFSAVLPDFRVLEPHFTCAFRRLNYDGLANARFEIGFSVDKRLSNRVLSRQRDLPVSSILDFVRLRRVRIRQLSLSKGVTKPIALGNAGDRLCEFYLAATTKHAAFPLIQSSWASACRPLFLVQYRHTDCAWLPATARSAGAFPDSAISLHYDYIDNDRDRTPSLVWFLGHSSDLPQKRIRRIRIYLTRFHAESSVAIKIIQMLASGRLKVDPRTIDSDNLQSYFSKAVTRLQAPARSGLPPDLGGVIRSIDCVSEGERLELVRTISHMRRQIAESVRKFSEFPGHSGLEAKRMETRKTPPLVSLGEGSHVNNLIVSSKNFRVEGHVANENDERTQLLRDISRELQRIRSYLDANTVKDMDDCFDVLTEQAKRSEPNRRLVTVSAEGIVEAAKKTGEASVPLLEMMSRLKDIFVG